MGPTSHVFFDLLSQPVAEAMFEIRLRPYRMMRTLLVEGIVKIHNEGHAETALPHAAKQKQWKLSSRDID